MKWLLAWLLLSLIPSTQACRYNVRDVGFVDLENEPFHFYCFVRQATAPEQRAWLESHAGPILENANLRFEIVDADAQPNHPALIHRPAAHSGPEPIAVLLSPDQQELRWPLTTPGVGFSVSAPAALSNLVASPFRSALVAATARAFGVVMLLEGTDTGSNERARRSIQEAIEQIRPQMRLLPKPIDHPPEVVTMDLATQAKETLLLWTLRLDSKPAALARAVVLYGKTRWIGPLMTDAEISSRNITGLFSFVGADCECGLDLSWTQGTRLPIAWPESLRAALAKSLGFDPEHPLVKTEVAAILGKRGSAVPGERASSRSAPSPASVAPPPPQVEARPGASSTPHTADATPKASAFLLWFALLGLASLVVILGLVIAWRAGRSH